MLSTDLRFPSSGKLLEVLPLPASPYEIKEGNVSSFKKMIELFNLQDGFPLLPAEHHRGNYPRT